MLSCPLDGDAHLLRARKTGKTRDRKKKSREVLENRLEIVEQLTNESQ